MSEEERQFKFQLLSFAKDILWEDYSNRRQKSDSEFSMLENAWRENRLKEMPTYKTACMLTADEIIKMAQEFEKYCSGSKKSK